MIATNESSPPLFDWPQRAAFSLLLATAIGGCSAAASDDVVSNAAEAVSTQVGNVTFRTQLAGNFVGAVNGGGGAVVATATVAQGWETFTLVDVNGGALVSGDQVFVRTGNGDYWQAASGGGSTLNAASTRQAGWETFRIVKASGSGAVQSGDVVGLQAVTGGQWVSAQNGGGGSVFAYGAALGAWEKLVIGIGPDAPDAGAASPDSGGTGTGPGAGGFAHPGVLVDKAQLDFVKSKVTANASPWKAAFDEANGSASASLSYRASPVATVECGPYSNPDIGCSNEKDDAKAAYTHALLWYFTGNDAHAKKAIEIMNAWSTTLKAHTNSNAPLQSAWCASIWPRAAEILRYTYGGWAPADVARFAALLRDVYLPEVINGSSSNGNWELSMIEAAIGIGVFLDDHATFDKAVAMWRKRVPAYVYLQTDGALPVPPPSGNKTTKDALIGYWYNQSTFVDGLSQETCRDLGHVQYGFAAMTNAAETARLQGVNLYGAEAKRLAAGYELHAKYLNGAAVPSWLCGGSLQALSPDPMWEIGYNALVNREGLSLPQTKTLIGKIRPTFADHHMIWETLTHAETGSVGVK